MVKYGSLAWNVKEAYSSLQDTPISLKITALPATDAKLVLPNNHYTFGQPADELGGKLLSFSNSAWAVGTAATKDLDPGLAGDVVLDCLGIPVGWKTFLGGGLDMVLDQVW